LLKTLFLEATQKIVRGEAIEKSIFGLAEDRQAPHEVPKIECGWGKCITALLHHSITSVSITDHEDHLIIDPG
jgi:hypothetical protein